MIIDHTHENYKLIMQARKGIKHNGAYYYSKEITKYIIPNVKTERNWVTIRVGELALNDSIVFIHNNIHTDRYEFLSKYHNQILVCGVPETCEKVADYGTPIYLPLSVNVQYVAQFKQPLNMLSGICYVGRKSKANYEGVSLPDDIDYISDLPRQELIKTMAKYKYVYAIGRTAIEAKILGCEVLPFDPRYPDPDIWQPLDTMDAAKMLQEELDKIDSRKIHTLL